MKAKKYEKLLAERLLKFAADVILYLRTLRLFSMLDLGDKKQRIYLVRESSELKKILGSILNKLICFLIFFGLGTWNLGFGTSTTDSLKNVIQTATHDTTKIKALNALGWELMYSNPDTAITLSTRALKMSEKISASPDEALAQSGQKVIAKSYNNLGWFVYLKGNYPQALDFYFKALEIWKTISPPSGGPGI